MWRHVHDGYVTEALGQAKWINRAEREMSSSIIAGPERKDEVTERKREEEESKG
jgi:hypothetical protein